LANATPNELKSSKILSERIEKVRIFREKSTAKPTREKAQTAWLYFFDSQPNSSYLFFPGPSSEKRKYIPIGYLSENDVAGNAALILPNAQLYHFGILTSFVHMAWVKTIAGRLKSDYRYSNNIVYNNFPWCDSTPEQKAKIEQTAQGILDARALYPDCSLADLYDETTMPPELRKAHKANDKAVIQAYGFKQDMTESEIVAELMKMYQKLTGGSAK
jgi:hypothetical protein